MARTLHLDVEVTVADDADDIEVADGVLNILCDQIDAPYVSCDGVTP